MIASRFSRAVLAAALCVAPLSAQAGFDDIVPRDTLVWIGCDDTAGLIDGMSRTAQGRLFADPAFAPLRAELELGFASWIEHGREELGVDLAALAQNVEGRLAFALLEAASVGDADSPPDFSVALLADLRAGAAEDVLDDLDRLAERVGEELGDALVLKFEDRAGVPATLLVDTQGDSTLAYAVDADVLVITLEVGATQESATLETLLFALQGDGESALEEQPRFSASPLAGAALPTRVRGWFDMPALLQRIAEAQGGAGQAPPPEFAELGLDALGALTVVSHLDDAGRQAQRFDMRWGEAFFLSPLLEAARGSGSPAAFDWMPPDAEFGVAVDLDVPGLFDAVLEMVTAKQPEAARELVTGMAAVEGELGFHPRDDIMEALSGQFGFFGREPAGGVAPGDMFGAANGFALMAGLDDAALMGEFFDAVIRSQGLHVARQREVFEGFEVFALPVFPGITLHYSLGGDVLVLSTNGDHVRDVLRRRADPELASFGNSELMREARAQLPADASVLFAMDAAASAEGMFELPAQMAELFAFSGEIPPMIPWGGGEERVDELLQRLVQLMPGRDIVAKHVKGYALTSAQFAGSGTTITSTAP